MNEGIIASLVADRGFGFISQEGHEDNIFFHSKELIGVEIKELEEGDKVRFDIGEGPKGLLAANVERIP